VWPEQTERLAGLRRALDVARSMPVTIDQEGAVDWVAAIRPRDGVATVLYHSVMWQYLTDNERLAIESSVRSIGSRATAEGPLAWLRLEPPPGGQNPMELKLTVWPGGDEETLAVAGFHRQPVQWLYSRPA
jgi:hypothetical protein